MAQFSEIPDSNKLVQLLELEEDLPSKPDDLSIKEKIGRGSYGTVYNGTYKGDLVAVKILPDLQLDMADDEVQQKEYEDVRKFMTEFDFLKKLRRSHIVKCFGAFYDREKKEPMIVMELMAKTLQAYLKSHKKTLVVSKQIHICRQIAEGVYFLHHQQPPVAHRDLTDKNVLVTESGTAKISDFGQAKFKPSINRCYFSSATPGSLVYMPPEVHGDSPQYTESIDIFSLGVLTIQIATQCPPTVKTTEIGSKKEVERRGKDLELMGEHHPLKPLVARCLQDHYKSRPSIDDVMAVLSNLMTRDNHEQASDRDNDADDSIYNCTTLEFACRSELYEYIALYIQAAKECVWHRDAGKQLLLQAAKDLEKEFKQVAAAKMVGTSMTTAGGILGIVGAGSLLLGGSQLLWE